MSKELPRRKPTIQIVTATRDNLPSGFALDYARILADTAVALEGQANVQMSSTNGTYIHINRQRLAELAIRDGADYIFWLDDDMRFPKNALLRLLQRMRGGAKIVGTNYPTRKPPYVPTAVLRKDALYYPEEGARGLTKVEAIGFGCCLISADVFRAMPTPWFENPFDRDGGQYVGEDFLFCQQAAKHGFDTYVDDELSWEVRHIGQFEFSLEHALACREVVTDGDNDVLAASNGGRGVAEPDGPESGNSGLHRAGGGEVQAPSSGTG